MEKKKILRDYMLKGGAKNKAFISNNGEVYIVKGFLISPEQGYFPLIDVDLITSDNRRKRTGLPLWGRYNHLYDDKATFSDIRTALEGNKMTKTLHDEYRVNPFRTVEKLCRDKNETERRVLVCLLTLPEGGNKVGLHMSELLTKKPEHHYIPDEKLKDYALLNMEDLNEEERLEARRREESYREIKREFSELAKNLQA